MIHKKYISVKDKDLIAIIPLEQKVAWEWAIMFAFAIPEFGTFIRSLRICFFKNIRSCSWREFGVVWVTETSHVVGLALLAFKVFPELDSIKAVMLTNCLCFLPSVYSMQFVQFMGIIFINIVHYRPTFKIGNRG